MHNIQTSLRTHLDTHATKHLDTRVKSLETLGDKLIEMDMCVQNKSKDVFYTEEGEAYIHRQQDLFIYKVLRDMHKDVYVDSEDLLPWSIDRDGDFIMYVKDIASTGAEADEADRLGEQLVGLRS